MRLEERHGFFYQQPLSEKKGRGKDFGEITTEPAAIFFDNIRIVTEKPAGPDKLILADFDAQDTARWTVSGGAESTIVANPGQVSGTALKLVLAPEGKAMRLDFGGMEKDWLTYDLLSFDLHAPTNVPMRGDIRVKIADQAGRHQVIVCNLQAGRNAISLPLEIAADVSLGKVQELSFFTGGSQIKELYMDNVSLQRVGRQDYPTVRDAGAQDAAVILDMRDFKFPRNTCFRAMAFIPLSDGKTQVVRCNSAGRGELQYALPAAAFDGYLKEKPVQLWLFVSDHGEWFWWQRTITYDGKTQTVKFN